MDMGELIHCSLNPGLSGGAKSQGLGAEANHHVTRTRPSSLNGQLHGLRGGTTVLLQHNPQR
jgi:hypothetical protein